MDLKLFQKENIYMITAKGAMDLYSAIPLKDLAINIFGKNIDRLIVNLKNVHSIDSGGIGALINICSTAKKLNAGLYIVNVQQSVKTNIKSMKVIEYIPFADSVNEAVLKLKART